MSRVSISAVTFALIGVAILAGEATALEMAKKPIIRSERAIQGAQNDVSKPIYVAKSSDGDPLATSPWISPTKLILVPTNYGDTKVFEMLDAKTGDRTPIDYMNEEFKVKDAYYNPWAVSLSPDG